MSAEVRRVARLVLLDPDDRILLMHGFEPEDPSRTWWFTPGGGLEGDETHERAALRELVEETGITEAELGPVVWRRRCSFDFDGRRWDQDEWYFLARTAQTATDTSGHTWLERRSVTGLRWWTSAELSATRETVYPTGLADLLGGCSKRALRVRRWTWPPEAAERPGRRSPAHNGETHG